MLTNFNGNLFCTLETGHILVVGGRSIDSAARIDINLAAGKMEGINVPLHISARFHEDTIVRNSLIDGVWGEEHREENLHELTVPNPLIAGDEFQFYILVGDDRFHVAINGSPYCTYPFRTAIEDIRAITVDKDVQEIYQIDHRQAYPSPYPLIQVSDPRTTFSNDIPKPMVPGHVTVITAIPFGSAKGFFKIRFCEGDTKKQALHFNARFDSKVLVRNSTNDNLSWLSEERNGGFPFIIDQQFKLAIAFTDNAFRFAINGVLHPVYSYSYKTPNLLDILNGFKASCGGGLQLVIMNVDHLQMGSSDCEGFETYSHPDVCLS